MGIFLAVFLELVLGEISTGSMNVFLRGMISDGCCGGCCGCVVCIAALLEHGVVLVSLAFVLGRGSFAVVVLIVLQVL